MIPDDIQLRIEADFGSVNTQLVRSDLEKFIEIFIGRYGSDPSNRVVRCIVHLAKGKREAFAHYVQSALEDWRDIAYWAEYDKNDQRIHDFELPFGATSTSLNYSHWVELAAVELVQKHDLDEIESSLVGQGCPLALAAKLVLLIPSAFAAEHFEPTGIEFPKHFLIGEPGQYKEVLYSNEPIYGHARQLAKRWVAESRPSLVARVLDWSGEANGIKEAQAKGLTPRKISTVHHGPEW